MRTARPIRVVMLGGGYTTIHAYRSLSRRVIDPNRGGACHITVVSADDHHNFHGFTGEVVAGLLPLAVTRTPLVQVLPKAGFVHGRVLRVDLAQRVVIAEPVTGGAEQRYPYDELIVGTGGREPVETIPGMAEHGFTLRAPGEFPRWLERLELVVEGASQDGPNAGNPRPDRLPAVVIVGGGMAGVELAAAVADRLQVSGAKNPVVLVHSGATVLSNVRADLPAVAARVDRELARLGVRIRSGVRVSEVFRTGVELSDGTYLATVAVLGTIGQRPVAIPGLEALPHDSSGRLVTDATLQVAPGVWAAGDAASVVHPRTGQPVPANALWAIKAGGHLGRNISRVVHRRAATPFRYCGLGMAMAFGLGRSATELYGIPIPGLAGWLLRLCFFLRFLPQRRRAVSVITELAGQVLQRRVRANPVRTSGAKRVSVR